MTKKEVVVGFFKAIDNNDFETARKLLGPHHQMHSSMSPVPMNAEQHIGMSKTFNNAFSNVDHEFEEILEIGNKIVVRGAWHGTHTDTFNGIPASGKTVHFTFIQIFEIENDALKNQWVELDSMSMMKQLGIMPEAARA
jgi:steroid delta-isomerase-like uncharacterized protein